MNLNDDDLTPSGAGDLPDPADVPQREPVATFTAPAYTHPDSIWSPRSRDVAPPDRPLPASPDYSAAVANRSARRARPA